MKTKTQDLRKSAALALRAESVFEMRQVIDALTEAANTARRAGLDKIEAIEAVRAGVRKHHIGINYKVTCGDVVRAVSEAYTRPSSLPRR
jgi:hypothetical protein